jgi:branched-chain amino acid transport system ATP-binding protein
MSEPQRAWPERPAAKQHERGAPSLLEVDGVTVRFGGHLALNEVSLEADPGTITGLIGPNGAGKTTLFNVITGLQGPQRGQVRLYGHPITKLPPYRRARLGMARTFQRLELFSLLTVRENVEVAASRRTVRPTGHVGRAGRREVNEILSLVGLAAEADVRADELPTGKARLVELARALATQPRVLLLDEPASGQDDQETDAFREVLLEIARREVAVVLVEHDVALVMRTCDRVHVLDFGSMLAAGTPAEIQSNQAVRDAYLGSAVGGVTA